jgi:hypothetical protein
MDYYRSAVFDNDLSYFTLYISEEFRHVHEQVDAACNEADGAQSYYHP